MACCTDAFAILSDDQLLAEVARLAAEERGATAALIRSLIELDTRRLYLGAGCSSLFTYCAQVLHLAEGAAYNRIEAARAARRFPCILEALEDGSVTLTTIRLLAPHLTVDNHERVLAAARHKSKRDIELLAASLKPQPDAAAVIRKLPQPRQGATDTPGERPALLAPARAGGSVALPPPAVPAPRREPLTVLAPERYKVQFTISRDTHEKLRRVQDLLRHSLPSGDLAEIFDRALTMLVEDLERRRFGATPRRRSSRGVADRSRHIPAAVRRAVWKRDGGRCAFVGTHGRCTERGFLEFHHVQPYAAGGAATAENIQLRCRAHNTYEAALFFGGGRTPQVREHRACWTTVYNEGAPGWRNWQTLGT